MTENMTPLPSDADMLDAKDDTFDIDCKRAASNHNHPHRDYTGLPLWTDATSMTDKQYAEWVELRIRQSYNVDDCDVPF